MYNEKIYSVEEIRDLLNSNKDFLKSKFKVENFFLFGSYAKNTQTMSSDIDLLVNFIQPIDMFDFVDLQDYLVSIFKKKIDLGTVNSLKDYVKSSILKDAIIL